MKVETNYEEVIKELNNIISELQSFQKRSANNLDYWPKLRDKLKIVLIKTFNKVHDVPTSEFWSEQKRRNMGQILRSNPPYRTERFPGQFFPIISDENWIMTGVMERTLTERLVADQGQIIRKGNEVELSLNVDIGDMTQENGEPYPIRVDEKLMELTGDEVGIFRPSEEDLSQIIDMLVVENEKVFNTIFGATK